MTTPTTYKEVLQQINDGIVATHSFIPDDKLTPKQLQLRIEARNNRQSSIETNCNKGNHNYICVDPNKRDWACEYCGKGE
jgi:hypothetical protein